MDGTQGAETSQQQDAYPAPAPAPATTFGSDQYGGSYGQAPQGNLGAAPQAFGGPSGGYGGDSLQQPYGAQPAAGGYGGDSLQQPYGTQQPDVGGYGASQQDYNQPYQDPSAQYGGYSGPQDGSAGFAAQMPPHGYTTQDQGYPPVVAPPVVAPPAGAYGAPPQVAVGIHAPAVPPNLPPSALCGFLVSYQLNAQGDFWPLVGGRKTIGRVNPENNVADILIPDQTISSRHAAITVDAASGSIAIEDTGSTNGTFVNDEHVANGAGKRELRDGDRVRLGGLSTIVKIIR